MTNPTRIMSGVHRERMVARYHPPPGVARGLRASASLRHMT